MEMTKNNPRGLSPDTSKMDTIETLQIFISGKLILLYWVMHFHFIYNIYTLFEQTTKMMLSWK